VLGLASTTGWTAEALEFVASAKPGRAFAHGGLLLYLIDLGTGQVYRNQFDTRLKPLANIFAGLLPEEELERVVTAIRSALVLNGSLTLAQVAQECEVAEDIVRQAFDSLAKSGGCVIAEVPGIGLAITRR
jgi:hypothetical protein